MKRISKRIILISTLFVSTLPSICFGEEPDGVKVIMLIGDGLGPNQLGLLKTAWDYGRSKGLVPDRQNSYDNLISEGVVSLISVKPHGYLVADSACAASSILITIRFSVFDDSSNMSDEYSVALAEQYTNILNIKLTSPAKASKMLYFLLPTSLKLRGTSC